MTIPLKTKPGINGANVLSIPQTWDPVWFRHFIHNSLKGADVRNAVGTGGIVVSGNISSPYATIDGSGIAAGVTQIVAGSGVSISPVGGTGAVTITNAGVTQIIAGAGVSVSPVGGTGAVTITNAAATQSVAGTTNEISVSTSGGVSTISFAQNVIVPSPPSGTTLTVDAPAAFSVPTLLVDGSPAGPVAQFVSGNAPAQQFADIIVSRSSSTANTIALGPCYNMIDLTGGTQTMLQHAGGQSELWQFNGGWQQAWKIDTSLNMTVTNSLTTGRSVISTGTTGLTISTDNVQINGGNSAQIMYINVAGGTDSKVWDCFAGAANYNFRCINDANSAANTWLQVSRSATTPTSIAFFGTSITFNGASLVGGSKVISVSFTGITSGGAITGSTNAGATTYTRNAAGDYTITWAPGFTPVAANVTCAANHTSVCQVVSLSSTSIRIQIANAATATLSDTGTIYIMAQ